MNRERIFKIGTLAQEQVCPRGEADQVVHPAGIAGKCYRLVTYFNFKCETYVALHMRNPQRIDLDVTEADFMGRLKFDELKIPPDPFDIAARKRKHGIEQPPGSLFQMNRSGNPERLASRALP